MSDEKDNVPNPFELEFEEFLRDDKARLAALYRKLPLAAPDTELDARVHALAQRALLSTDDDASDATRDDSASLTPTQMYLRHPRWLPALSAAAVLVLAAGIVWRVMPSGSGDRERLAPTAAVTTGELKAKTDAAPVDKTTAMRGHVLADAPADNPAPAAQNTTESGAAALTKAKRRAAAEPAPAKPAVAAVAERAASPGAPQAFPAAPAQQETVRKEREKVENTASPAAYAPAPATSAPATAASAARVDESRAMQTAPLATPGGSSASSGDAARAPAAKSLSTDKSAGIASGVQSSIATCPASQAGDWRGHYPPEIPPSSTLRRQIVRTLIAQGHRDEARRAYTDFHAHCPADSWPPDLLNHMQVQ